MTNLAPSKQIITATTMRMLNYSCTCHTCGAVHHSPIPVMPQGWIAMIDTRSGETRAFCPDDLPAGRHQGSWQ